jgi:hypothetical protein
MSGQVLGLDLKEKYSSGRNLGPITVPPQFGRRRIQAAEVNSTLRGAPYPTRLPDVGGGRTTGGLWR